MKKNLRKRKAKKNRLQKKAHSLQKENAILLEKISQYEIAATEQAERFNRSEEEYQRRIDKLKGKIQLQRKEREPNFWIEITDWIFFGVISCILPLAMNVSFIWFIGSNVNLANVLVDFLLVLFATSMNLLCILRSAKKSIIIKFCFPIVVIIIELSLSFALYMERIPSILLSEVTISTVFHVAVVCIVFEVILGVLAIISQNITTAK